MYRIKKYKNRKMYCCELSRYLNLDEIAELIKNNNNVIIYDYDGNDITNKTLKEILPLCDIMLNDTINMIMSYYTIPIRKPFIFGANNDNQNNGTSNE